MQRAIRIQTALVIVAATLPIAACRHNKQNERSTAGNVAPPASTTPSVVPETAAGAPTAGIDTTHAKHHSKLAGAAVGAAAGHAAGHTVTGAAAGAIVQHERNKHKK